MKKKNIFSINFSDEAISCLQSLGYLDGRKKAVKGKNLSGFVSELVVCLKFNGLARKNFIKACLKRKKKLYDDLEAEIGVLVDEFKVLENEGL